MADRFAHGANTDQSQVSLHHILGREHLWKLRVRLSHEPSALFLHFLDAFAAFSVIGLGRLETEGSLGERTDRTIMHCIFLLLDFFGQWLRGYEALKTGLPTHHNALG